MPTSIHRARLPLGWAALATALFVATPSRAYTDMPALAFDGGKTSSQLPVAYDLALKNLLDINTSTYDMSLDVTGFVKAPGNIIAPGDGYKGQVWTRDASINSIAAGSLLEPAVAQNTLWAACAKSNGKLIINQSDSQFWDRVIWVDAALHHFEVTGDQAFLTSAYEATTESLKAAESRYFDAEFGLFKGPSHINDGISAYPAPPASDPEKGSGSFEYADILVMMSLSSNVIHYRAYLDAAQMADALARPAAEAAAFRTKADALKTAINAKLWLPDLGSYGYFVHGAAALRGSVDHSQETLGLALAIMDGVASADQVTKILSHVAIAPRGVPDIYPHLARYDNAHPGRHNVSVWPYIQGLWADAMAQVGNEYLFRGETERLATSVTSPQQKGDQQFYEIYHFQTGLHDGGWQTGGSWQAAPNQTWSATGFLRMIYSGLFGMRFEPTQLRLAPLLPTGWGNATLKGVHYRGMTLDISLKGAGNKVASFSLDGTVTPDAVVPATLTGPHQVEITLGDAFVNVARDATVTSSATATDSPGVAGVNDGKINGFLAGPSSAATFNGNASGLNLGDERKSEWVSAPGAQNPWVRLDWSAPVTIRKLRLFDRINTTDQVTAGTVDFSDGTMLPVGALPNDGFSAFELDFPAKQVSWARFTINTTSAGTSSPGVAEIEVYADENTISDPTGQGGTAATTGGTATGTAGTATSTGGAPGTPPGGSSTATGGVSVGTTAGSSPGGAPNSAMPASSASGCGCVTAGGSGSADGAALLGCLLAGLVASRRRTLRVRS